MLRAIDLLQWCLLLISIFPSTTARIYVVKINQERDNTRSQNALMNRYKNKSPLKSVQEVLWHDLMSLLTPNFDEKSKNKCIRLFGSIYGTKAQRQECLEKLKKKQTIIKPEDLKPYQTHFNTVQYDDLLYFDPDPFNDLTRDVKYSTDYTFDYDDKPNNIIYLNKLRTKDISNIYILTNLQSVLPGTRNTPDYNIDSKVLRSNDASDITSSNSRRSNPVERISKRNMNVETSGESESSGSQESDDKYDKPKRFQVVANEKKKMKLAIKHKKNVNIESSGGSEESALSEDEKPKVKPKRIPIQQQKRPSKVQKTKVNRQKEYYLQGGRVIDPDSEDEFRRKLQYFLPKRFHWDEDEIHSLGYYWFNGPQGRYPHYALRP